MQTFIIFSVLTSILLFYFFVNHHSSLSLLFFQIKSSQIWDKNERRREKEEKRGVEEVNCKKSHQKKKCLKKYSFAKKKANSWQIPETFFRLDSSIANDVDGQIFCWWGRLVTSFKEWKSQWLWTENAERERERRKEKPKISKSEQTKSFIWERRRRRNNEV